MVAGPRLSSVAISGDGVAALCSAHLLRATGLSVRCDRTPRPRVPAIMLSDAALALIRDVFGRSALFTELPRIERRVVAWGEGAEPVALPHSAVVVSELMLLESLAEPSSEAAGGTPDFTVFASRPLPASATVMHFGTRRAAAVEVAVKDRADLATCWIESTSGGWLFLIPDPRPAAASWLLAVGAPPSEQLAESRLIAPRVEVSDAAAGEFPSCPRMISPLCGRGWLACGTAAMAFDPICGDGTANAVREALLGSAVIRALAAGGDSESLLAHYRTRLTAGMQKHLALSSEFYRSGGTGPWWRRELEALYDGFAYCGRELDGLPEPRYRLRGCELEAVA